MDLLYIGLLGIGIGMAIGLAAFGGGVGIGRAVSSALEGTARQPEAAGNIRTTLIIGAALVEALTIYALVSGILLMGKIPSPETVVEMFKIISQH